jgi:dynein heavy chain 2
VSGHVQSFNGDVERFAARWNQLKPNNDTLDADRATVLKAVAFIKEKRQEFDDLKVQSQKLM